MAEQDRLAAAGRYAVYLTRVDNTHSSIAQHVDDDLIWPDEAGWARLRAADVLDEESLPETVVTHDGFRLDLVLPMPGVARVRLVPIGPSGHFGSS